MWAWKNNPDPYADFRIINSDLVSYFNMVAREVILTLIYEVRIAEGEQRR